MDNNEKVQCILQQDLSATLNNNTEYQDKDVIQSTLILTVLLKPYYYQNIIIVTVACDL